MMDVQIRLPKIDGATDKEQLVQIKSYLRQLAEELNMAFAAIDNNKK